MSLGSFRWQIDWDAEGAKDPSYIFSRRLPKRKILDSGGGADEVRR